MGVQCSGFRSQKGNLGNLAFLDRSGAHSQDASGIDNQQGARCERGGKQISTWKGELACLPAPSSRLLPLS